jgi:D-alanine-D-alanine ligase
MRTVGVIYGGSSPEYAVSLRSAETVLQHLDRQRFKVVTIHITQEFSWIVKEENQEVEYKTIPSILPCDVILSVMHGSLGEDGSMQGLFELWKLPYVGSGVLGSALGMDKLTAKQIVTSQGIMEVAPYVALTRHQWHMEPSASRAAIKSIGYPVFVKPSNMGSSIGVQRVDQEEDLSQAVNNSLNYNSVILVERALSPCRELEVGVLGNLQEEGYPLVSVVGEINTQHKFYSYDAKYTHPTSTIIKIPAMLNATQSVYLQSAATRIFNALRLKDMARIDFFLAEERFYFNEVNTLPGFTSNSMYPKVWEATGKNFTQLLTELIELALKDRVTFSNQVPYK